MTEKAKKERERLRKEAEARRAAETARRNDIQRTFADRGPEVPRPDKPPPSVHVDDDDSDAEGTPSDRSRSRRSLKGGTSGGRHKGVSKGRGGRGGRGR